MLIRFSFINHLVKEVEMLVLKHELVEALVIKVVVMEVLLNIMVSKAFIVIELVD